MKGQLHCWISYTSLLVDRNEVKFALLLTYPIFVSLFLLYNCKVKSRHVQYLLNSPSKDIKPIYKSKIGRMIKIKRMNTKCKKPQLYISSPQQSTFLFLRSNLNRWHRQFWSILPKIVRVRWLSQMAFSQTLTALFFQSDWLISNLTWPQAIWAFWLTSSHLTRLKWWRWKN